MDKSPAISRSKRIAAHDLESRLESPPWQRLALDLESPNDSTLGEWLVFCCCGAALGKSALDPVDVHLMLRDARLAAPEALSCCDPPRLVALLEDAGCKQPEAAATLLVRASSALMRRHSGSVERLIRDALDLESLGGSLARLARGFGRASVVRFLRPLHERIDVVADLPMEPAAIAAAAHLGYCATDTEPELAASILRKRLAEDAAGAGGTRPPPFRDFEWSLDQLGRSACLRERTARCPLGGDCPRRDTGAAG